MITIAPVTPDATGFEQLLADSRAGNHKILVHFEENWRSGANVFARRGEIMLGAWDGDTLVATCGRNVDPYDPNPKAGRVRHLYVAQNHRRQGIGELLIAAIRADAAHYFDYLNTNAPEPAFAFYIHLGFEPLNDEYGTHRYVLTPA